jgi:hypothetical protein
MLCYICESLIENMEDTKNIFRDGKMQEAHKECIRAEFQRKDVNYKPQE